MNSYEIGEVVRNSFASTNLAGTAVDPGALTVNIKTPLGALTTYVYGIDLQLVKDSTGNYHVDVDAVSQGRWIVKWVATGANKGAKTNKFQVVEDFFD